MTHHSGKRGASFQRSSDGQHSLTAEGSTVDSYDLDEERRASDEHINYIEQVDEQAQELERFQKTNL